MSLLARLRDRYHPLFRLRRSRMGATLLRALDFPLPRRFQEVPFPVWIRTTRHAGLLLLGPQAERPLHDAFLSAAVVGGASRLWDVGANIGWYSWVFISHVPDARAVLLEPDPVNLALLRRTAVRLKDRAAILPVAAGDRTGRTRFAADAVMGATGSLMIEDTFLSRHYGRSGRLLEVDSIRLDDLQDQYPPPDFLKIDVEGAEHLVFAGGSLIVQRQPVIIYETSAANRGPISARLTQLGYSLYDAEAYGRRQQISPNVLAWPARLSNRTDALLEHWRSRRDAPI